MARYGMLRHTPRTIASPSQWATIRGEAHGVRTVAAISDLDLHKLERHFHATHVFIPMSGSLAAVAVALPTDEDDPTAIPDPNDVRAFLIDGTKGFGYKRGTWHSLDRYVLSPPGTTFVAFNNSPNPTQTVDFMEGFSLNHQDLTTDTNPSRIDLKDVAGLTFEIVP